MIATLAQYVAIKQGAPRFAAAGISLTWLEWAMVLFLILGQLTVYNRLRGMLRQIRKKEWLLHDRERLSGKKILVVYDSLTSNTERVARSAGEALGADVIKADHAPGPEKYDWIILATPDIRAQATSSIQKYCADHRTGIGRYGIIVTYGMPVWGPLSART
jgi:hypothetical protein